MNHQAEAQRLLNEAEQYVSETWPHQTGGEHKADILAAAQVQATLALAEQQKIANLIALEAIYIDSTNDRGLQVFRIGHARGEADADLTGALGFGSERNN